MLFCYIKTSVSLSSPVVKIFESIVKDNIMNNNSLLPPNQHGFIPQKSYTSHDQFQLLDLAFQLMYLDFHKAFDSVPHHHLLNKIYGYDIQGHLLLSFTLLVVD